MQRPVRTGQQQLACKTKGNSWGTQGERSVMLKGPRPRAKTRSNGMQQTWTKVTHSHASGCTFKQSYRARQRWANASVEFIRILIVQYSLPHSEGNYEYWRILRVITTIVLGNSAHHLDASAVTELMLCIYGNRQISTKAWTESWVYSIMYCN